VKDNPLLLELLLTVCCPSGTDIERQITPKSDVHLFKPEEAYRMPGGGFRIPPGASIGENPPAGVSIWYHLKEKPKGEVQIEILDAAGKSVKKFSSKPPEGGVTQAGTPGDEEGGGRFSPAPARVPVEKGLNRFVWDLRYPDAARFPGMILWAGNTSGPRAVP